jgi:hypothetical protein
MRDLNILPSHQVLDSLHTWRPIKAEAVFWAIQWKQFSHSATHGIVVFDGPNCSREQALSSFVALISFVDV